MIHLTAPSCIITREGSLFAVHGVDAVRRGRIVMLPFTLFYRTRRAATNEANATDRRNERMLADYRETRLRRVEVAGEYLAARAARSTSDTSQLTLI